MASAAAPEQLALLGAEYLPPPQSPVRRPPVRRRVSKQAEARLREQRLRIRDADRVRAHHLLMRADAEQCPEAIGRAFAEEMLGDFGSISAGHDEKLDRIAKTIELAILDASAFAARRCGWQAR